MSPFPPLVPPRKTWDRHSPPRRLKGLLEKADAMVADLDYAKADVERGEKATTGGSLLPRSGHDS
jgi:hypothetical protein